MVKGRKRGAFRRAFRWILEEARKVIERASLLVRESRKIRRKYKGIPGVEEEIEALREVERWLLGLTSYVRQLDAYYKRFGITKPQTLESLFRKRGFWGMTTVEYVAEGWDEYHKRPYRFTADVKFWDWGYLSGDWADKVAYAILVSQPGFDRLHWRRSKGPEFSIAAKGGRQIRPPEVSYYIHWKEEESNREGEMEGTFFVPYDWDRKFVR